MAVQLSLENTLPVFETEATTLEGDSGRERWLEVTCPRKACLKVFMVRAAWRRSGDYATAACPHCFKVARKR